MATIVELTAVAAPSGYVGVFGNASDNHLYERHFTGQGNPPWAWIDHGSPPGAPSGSNISAVAAPSGYVGVFIGGVFGHLYELAAGGDGDGHWTWYDHGTLSDPAAGNVRSLSAVAAPSGYIGAFTGASNGHLYERYFTGHGSPPWAWTDHGPLPGRHGIQGPSAVAAPSGYVGVFTSEGNGNGHLYERYFTGHGSPPWAWTDHGPPPGASCYGSPSAVAAPSGYVGVFIRGGNHLYERYFTGHGSPPWAWTDHGPPPGASCGSSLSAVAAPSGYVGVFVMGSNGHLYERYFVAGSGWFWTDHGPPPGSDCFSPPSAVAAPSGYVGVFVMGSNGHLYERYFVAGSGWFWTNHGSPP